MAGNHNLLDTNLHAGLINSEAQRQALKSKITSDHKPVLGVTNIPGVQGERTVFNQNVLAKCRSADANRKTPNNPWNLTENSQDLAARRQRQAVDIADAIVACKAEGKPMAIGTFQETDHVFRAAVKAELSRRGINNYTFMSPSGKSTTAVLVDTDVFDTTQAKPVSQGIQDAITTAQNQGAISNISVHNLTVKGSGESVTVSSLHGRFDDGKNNAKAALTTLAQTIQNAQGTTPILGADWNNNIGGSLAAGNFCAPDPKTVSSTSYNSRTGQPREKSDPIDGILAPGIKRVDSLAPANTVQQPVRAAPGAAAAPNLMPAAAPAAAPIPMAPDVLRKIKNIAQNIAAATPGTAARNNVPAKPEVPQGEMVVSDVVSIYGNKAKQISFASPEQAQAFSRQVAQIGILAADGGLKKTQGNNVYFTPDQMQNFQDMQALGTPANAKIATVDSLHNPDIQATRLSFKSEQDAAAFRDKLTQICITSATNKGQPKTVQQNLDGTYELYFTPKDIQKFADATKTQSKSVADLLKDGFQPGDNLESIMARLNKADKQADAKTKPEPAAPILGSIAPSHSLSTIQNQTNITRI